MAERVRHYAFCGWRIASAIELPELPLWPDEPSDVDVTITFGEVPDDFPGAGLSTPFLQADAAGRVRYVMPGVADFLIEQGARITIAPTAATAWSDIRLILLGSVFGILCNQRGVLPLHASAVEIDGRAVAFAGASGMGKSTLAAAFNRRGFRLLADDVTPIDFGTGSVRFLPGLRRIRLWADSVAAASWDPAGLERCREGLDKFSRVFDDDFATEPLAPRALFHLRQLPQAGGGVTFEPLHGVAAVRQVRRQVYRWRQLRFSVGEGEANARVVRAAAAIPRHYTLTRHLDYSQRDATIDAILDIVRSGR